MGLVDSFRDAQRRSDESATYGTHRMYDGEYTYLPSGKFKSVKKSIAGAVAEFESGADISGRTTLTRVLAGAVIAGPAGAVIGALFKKDRAKVYVTVTFADGDVAIIEGPVKDESKLRDFTRKVNAAA